MSYVAESLVLLRTAQTPLNSEEYQRIRNYRFMNMQKSKAIPLQAWTGPEGSRRLRLPVLNTIGNMKVVRFSAISTDRLYPQEIFLEVLISG
jgi:hypothetical protein